MFSFNINTKKCFIIKYEIIHPLHILPAPQVNLVTNPLLTVRICVVAILADWYTGEAVRGLKGEGLGNAWWFVGSWDSALLELRNRQIYVTHLVISVHACNFFQNFSFSRHHCFRCIVLDIVRFISSI